MKIKIEIDKTIKEREIIIRSDRITDEILELQSSINSIVKKKKEIVFYKDETEYFIKFTEILFFETEESKIYGHTRDNLYYVKYKLYELEEILPDYFVRISKSTIANLREISSIKKNLTSVSTINFYKSHKINYVSRYYFKNFKERLEEVKR